MNKRPIAVVVIACLYILTGMAGTAAQSMEARQGFESDMIWAVLVSVLAIIAGVFILEGRNWARWLAVGWIGFHVVLSIHHSKRELGLHVVLFVAITYFLFRRGANRYFRPAATAPAP
jgi:uncharacterized membrane protein YphA (DoxX/SURF4 family)